MPKFPEQDTPSTLKSTSRKAAATATEVVSDQATSSTRLAPSQRLGTVVSGTQDCAMNSSTLSWSLKDEFLQNFLGAILFNTKILQKFAHRTFERPPSLCLTPRCVTFRIIPFVQLPQYYSLYITPCRFIVAPVYFVLLILFIIRKTALSQILRVCLYFSFCQQFYRPYVFAYKTINVFICKKSSFTCCS